MILGFIAAVVVVVSDDFRDLGLGCEEAEQKMKAGRSSSFYFGDFKIKSPIYLNYHKFRVMIY
mgnify:CR=1 FL=1